jgi:CHAD domain-containing protein
MIDVYGTIDAYLDDQRDVLTRDPHDLYDGEGVHKTRVAARRFRSVLRVFADRFDPTAAEHLDVELAWYAGVLGEVRDLEVFAAWLAESVDALPDDLGVDREVVGREMAKLVTARERRARRKVARALVSRRRDALLAEVVAVGPDVQSDRCLADYLRDAESLARKRLRQARELADDDENRNFALHRARKAAKRARYTAELCASVTGKAGRTAKRWQAMQDELGEHQDRVVAAGILRELATSDADFVLGIMWALARSG